MQKKWNVKKYDIEKVEEISNKFNISNNLAKLLISRNIGEDEIENFLNGTLKDLKDPYEIKDMEKIVTRIMNAIERKEKICIYGDYDVDGITSITIMYKFLRELSADVSYYLPDRLIEGYGVNKDAIKMIADTGVKLIITVDCGITAVSETEFAKELGIDMCITDHHECGDVLPDAFCIVNPKQKDDTFKFKFHAGVGVAFKCLQAISNRLNMDESSYLKYLDIVAIGTVSDIVPLLDENRIISKYGIKMIENTDNVGLKALLNIVNFKNLDSTMISFGLAPRINACGRMGNASLAVKLFLEENSEVARELAITLDKLNSKRQQIEKEIYESAMKVIEEKKLYNKSSIVLYNEDWHSGVIGIVASRIVNMYNKPVILLIKENGMIRGSGRCAKGISLYESLDKCKEDLIQFGGHELAAGLSMEEKNVEKFIYDFENVICEKLGGEELSQVVDIDFEISLSDLNVELLKDIYTLKPYGQSNRAPLFLYRNLRVQAVRTIGDGKHLKLVLKDKNKYIDVVGFSQGEKRDAITIGDKIDVVCEVELNEYNGKRTIQLILQDFKKSI